MQIVLALALVLTPLAGCIGSEDPASAEPSTEPEASGPPLFTSFDAAMAASGETFAPEDNGTSLELKLLSPADTGDVDVAKQNITLLLYDASAMAPIEDANVTLDAIMTAMGHGTSPEEDPVHDAHGVYQGMTNLMMDGVWALDVTAALADGGEATWSIDVKVGDVGGEHPNAKTVHHRFEDTFEETVTAAEHAKSWSFPVNATGASIHINISMAEPKPTDELTFALLDAEGNEATTTTLTADTPTATVTAPNAPNNGTYTLDVTGRALDTAYTADVDIVWTTKEAPSSGDHGGHDSHGGHDH